MDIRYAKDDGGRVYGLHANPECGRPNAGNRAWGACEGATSDRIRYGVRNHKGRCIAGCSPRLGGALQHSSTGGSRACGSGIARTPGFHCSAMGRAGKKIQKVSAA